MIEINLLPGAGRKKAASRQSVDFGTIAAGVSGRLRDKFMIAAVASVVVSAGVVGALYTMQGRQEETLAEHRVKALADSTRYANFLKDRYRAEATRDTLLRQVNVIRSIDEDRYVWPHVLDEISRALPQYTWLTAVGFTGTPQGSNNVVVSPKAGEDTSAAAKKRPPKRMDTAIPKDVITIRISGRTVDIQAVTRFWKDLEASPYLTNVQLDKSELAVGAGEGSRPVPADTGVSPAGHALVESRPSDAVGEVIMALLPQTDRDKKLLVVALLAIGLAAVYQQLVWTPKHTELQTIAFRLDTLDSLNRLTKIEVAKGNSAKMKAEADGFGRELEVLRRLVPTENEVPALVESISSAARRAGLELADVQPDGVVNGDQFDTYRYKIGVTGPWHEVAEFLTNVGSMPRIVSPINLTLTASSRSGERRPKKNEQFLDARFGIQTYVAHAAARASGGKAGAP